MYLNKFSWFEWSWHKVLVGEPVGWIKFCNIKMSLSIFDINFFNFYKAFLFEDLVIVFFLYSFLKYIILGSFVELIWPTQYFNKKHNINVQFLKFRCYVSYILKLRNYTLIYKFFNLILIQNIFIKK